MVNVAGNPIRDSALRMHHRSTPSNEPYANREAKVETQPVSNRILNLPLTARRAVWYLRVRIESKPY
jgi:hypothetical protein